VAPALRNAQFVIIRVCDLSPVELRPAYEAFETAGGTARICLAGQRAALEAVADSNLDHGGFMLDDLDINTACAELLWDRLDAVRFSARFAIEAQRDIRAGCALDSMLGLAGELGLRTLGPRVPSTAATFKRFVFDYVPADTSSLTQEPAARLMPSRPVASIVSR